jgi:tetratricopeptide (TPR) repeat protein
MEKKRGGLIFLSGEAGTGKTRLMNELIALARRLGAFTLQGRCFGEPISFPYQPFKDALQKIIEIGNGFGNEVLLSLPDAYRNELLTLVPEFTGLGMKRGTVAELPSDQARLRLFDAVRQLLLRISQEGPLLLALEDLHLADESSSLLLHYLARNLKETPVLICGSYRSEELEAWKMGKAPFSKSLLSMSRDRLFSDIRLDNLSSEETTKMIELTLNAETVPLKFIELVFRETEGNPFFVEEVLKSLIEEGKISSSSDLEATDFETIETPSVVRDVIQRRLDTLDDEVRQVLSTASIIGDTFDFDMLSGMSELREGELIEELERAQRVKLVVEEKEDEYRFSHNKIRQVLYDGLPGRKRRKMHRLAGESIEKLIGEEKGDFIFDLSHHFTEGKEWARSFEYSRLAGKRAKERYDNNDALIGYGRALKAFENLSAKEQKDLVDSKKACYIDMGDVASLTGKFDDALRYYDEALALSREVGDKRVIADSLEKIGIVHSDKGLHDEALRNFEEALEISREIGDKSGIAQKLNNIGIFHHDTGSYDEALKFYEETLAISREIGDKNGIARKLNNIGLLHSDRGSYDEALRFYNESLAISREIGNKSNIGGTLNNIGIVHYAKGSYDDAVRYSEEALAISREIGDKSGLASDLNTIGNVHYVKGSFDKALKYYDEALAVSREIGVKRVIADNLNNIGNVHNAEGSYDEALRCYNESLAIKREIGDKRGVAQILNNIGLVHRDRGFYDEALRCYGESLAISREIGDKSGIVESLLSTGVLKRQCGLLDAAIDCHEQALELSIEICDKGGETRALVELGRVYLVSRNLDESSLRINDAIAATAESEGFEAEFALHQACGELYIATSETEKADTSIEKVLNLAEKTKSRKHLADAYLLKARACSSLEAEPYAEKALKLAEAMSAPEALWRSHHLMYRILKEKGDLDNARIHLLHAKEIVKSVSSRMTDPEMKRGYLSRPELRELFDSGKQE